ncbi:AzlC family ABC transporter permease [Rhizobium sp. SG2393]|uniref:AzlC family ABC transporter permease n=1 Tax=Rhizobium sp. SG2393 TaxID=3276279 RepID=UPI00366AF512
MSGSELMQGARRGIAVAVSAAPFGVLFGAVAVEKGLSVGDALLMSATIFAGASQLVGVELFQHSVQPWLVVLSVFAVNFRHVLYSAAITRHFTGFSLPQKLISFFLLTDPQFAEAERRVEASGGVGFVWYMGLGLTVYMAWLAATLVGTLFGRLIGDPKAIGLDVLLPIYFMGLVLGFRSRDNWLPVVAVSSVASIIAIKVVGTPWHVSLGALAGILVAALLPPRGGAAAEVAEDAPAGTVPVAGSIER